MPVTRPTRDEFIAACETRLIYDAIWSRRAADDTRAVIQPRCFSGNAWLLWELIRYHDDHHTPWPGLEPYDGQQRALRIAETIAQFEANSWEFDPPIQIHAKHVRQRLLTEQTFALAAVPHDGLWTTVTTATAIEALRNAELYAAARHALTAIDALIDHTATR